MAIKVIIGTDKAWLDHAKKVEEQLALLNVTSLQTKELLEKIYKGLSSDEIVGIGVEVQEPTPQ